MPATVLEHQGRPLYGVLLVALAAFTFAFCDVLTKHLAMHYPVPVVLAARYLINLGVLAALLGPRYGAGLWRTQRTWLVLGRGLCLAASSLTMGWALRVMPVGETVAIIYLSPFAVMLLAVPLLGEKVGLAALIGATFGFLGVLLIVRPGSGLDPLGVTFALINAGFSTAYHLLTRLLGRTETTIAMLVHVAWVGSAVFCVLSLPSLPGLSPSMLDIGMMILLGALATLGHFLFTAAYREAPASMLAPVNYLHLVWTSGLGWLVFGHLPDYLSLAGMALVVASGVAVALRSHAEQRRARDVALASLSP